MSASFLVLPDETAPKLLYETAPGEETEQPPLPSASPPPSPEGKARMEPCSERLLRSIQDPSTRFARSG